MSYDGRTHVWIRKEDKELWEAIEDKAQWLHDKLNYKKPFRAMNADEQAKHVASIINDPQYTPMDF